MTSSRLKERRLKQNSLDLGGFDNDSQSTTSSNSSASKRSENSKSKSNQPKTQTENLNVNVGHENSLESFDIDEGDDLEIAAKLRKLKEKSERRSNRTRISKLRQIRELNDETRGTFAGSDAENVNDDDGEIDDNARLNSLSRSRSRNPDRKINADGNDDDHHDGNFNDVENGDVKYSHLSQRHFLNRVQLSRTEMDVVKRIVDKFMALNQSDSSILEGLVSHAQANENPVQMAVTGSLEFPVVDEQKATAKNDGTFMEENANVEEKFVVDDMVETIGNMKLSDEESGFDVDLRLESVPTLEVSPLLETINSAADSFLEPLDEELAHSRTNLEEINADGLQSNNQTEEDNIANVDNGIRGNTSPLL